MTYYELTKITARIYRAIFAWHKARYKRERELSEGEENQELKERMQRPSIAIFPVSNIVLVNGFSEYEYTIPFSALTTVKQELEEYKKDALAKYKMA
ncbi:MAG TPA: hypothetical protein PLD32_13205 [Saprospiraceae bacterium]|nr:hypothetical protein [Saprospiraceae bacterium]HNC37518.1 hypothetical protein [Saprospiraceae bacterium]HNG70248.1 hypothetical protein [Saprospiraceae bacterium]